MSKAYFKKIHMQAQREAAEQRILDGPDCRAKSFLLARIKEREPEAPETMPERLKKPMELTGAPVQFDPENDPELQDNPSWEHG